MNKRLLSALLALCMMITLFPAAAFAAVDNAGGGYSSSDSGCTGHQPR